MATTDVLTLDEAKRVVDLTGSTTQDTELQARITTVSERLDKLIGPIVVRTVTGERRDGGYRSVFLRHYPITSITSVTEYRGTTATSLSEETLDSHPVDAYLAGQYTPDPSLLSQRLYRRRNGDDEHFARGLLNIEVSYEAGRFADTASVGERYKNAAALMLKNLWRSQQSSSGEFGEFTVPQSNFPTFAVPKAVREMLQGEIQQPRPKVA